MQGTVWQVQQNFNPRPPRGGRPVLTKVGSWIEKFQSTPSARRATHTGHHAGCAIDISIHALREEGDRKSGRASSSEKDFNPRPPRGGRPNTSYQRAVADIFQSTPSARRATTKHWRAVAVDTVFQSTPSARRATQNNEQVGPHFQVFQSTPSARRATDNYINNKQG